MLISNCPPQKIIIIIWKLGSRNLHRLEFAKTNSVVITENWNEDSWHISLPPGDESITCIWFSMWFPSIFSGFDWWSTWGHSVKWYSGDQSMKDNFHRNVCSRRWVIGLCLLLYRTQFHLKPKSVTSALFIEIHPIPRYPKEQCQVKR